MRDQGQVFNYSESSIKIDIRINSPSHRKSCTYVLLKNNCLDEDYPWSVIIAVTYLAVHDTYNTTIQATPVQLVFVRDMISNIPFIAYWEAISIFKQQLIDKNN